MNKFLTNFIRTGAMYPVHSSAMDNFWTGGAPAVATPTKEISDENKQASQGSSQIAVGLQNAQDRKEEEPKPLNIWEVKKDKDGNEIVEEPAPVLFSDLTPEQVDDFASKVEVLTDEDKQMIAVLAGDDPEKQKAMIQLMTNVGRSAVSRSVFSASKAFGAKVSSEFNSQDPKISKLVDEQVKQQALMEQFPMATNPNTAPIFKSVMQGVMRAMPDATKQQLMEETQRQLDMISKSAGAKVESPNNPSTPKGAAKETPWNNFFNE